jgi:hypothetical protein
VAVGGGGTAANHQIPFGRSDYAGPGFYLAIVFCSHHPLRANSVGQHATVHELSLFCRLE